MQYSYFTCPPVLGAIYSINSPSDSAASASICLEHLLPLLPHHDAFLVACYSQHPLVPLLRHECNMLFAASPTGGGGSGGRKYVTGILEASVTLCLNLVSAHNRELKEVLAHDLRPTVSSSFLHPEIDWQGFGIVSTAAVWQSALADAVHDLFGVQASDSFVGCETTGLNGDELHALPLSQVRQKMMQATKRLLQRGQQETAADVMAICLGCAGMAGLEEAVRAACLETLGEKRGRLVHIVDGVKAAVGVLVGLARGGF